MAEETTTDKVSPAPVADLKTAEDELAGSPLISAIMRDDMETASKLLTGAVDWAAVDHLGVNTIHVAAAGGHIEILRKAIEASAVDINSRCAYYTSQAVRKGQALALSLEGGSADIKLSDEDGATALHLAAAFGHNECVKLLLDKGADIKSRDNYGRTPLHTSASRGHVSIVKTLIDTGAKKEAKDNDEARPLHLAADKGYLDVVEALLFRQAKVNAEDEDGSTALHIASEKGNSALVSLLLKNGADVAALAVLDLTALHFAAEKGHLEVVNQLLEAGAKIDAKDMRGLTPLLRAVSGEHAPVVKQLLDKGASPMVVSEEGRAAASMTTNESIRRMLVEAGIEFAKKEHKEGTA